MMQVAPKRITQKAFPHQGIKCISTVWCWLILDASKFPKAIIIGVNIRSAYKKKWFSATGLESPSFDPPWGLYVCPITMKITPIKEMMVWMMENVFIFSLRTQTASSTVKSGPKLRNIDTLTMGRERIHTKMIIMMKQMWPSPTANVLTLSSLKGRVRL